MILFANVFPMPCVLLCGYYITKNVRGIIKGILVNKIIKCEYGEMYKPTQISEPIINVWNVTINPSTK